MAKKNKPWTETEYLAYMQKMGKTTSELPVQVKPSKYRTGPREERTYNGILFGSIKEMDYYKDLQLLVKGGRLKFFLRQVPFDLPGQIKYRVDFVEFLPDGTVRFVDVKGVETPVFKNKKKQVESLYPVKIELE